VYLSTWDNQGRRWSTPEVVSVEPGADQFNPWIDVDAATGMVHLMYYSTRGDRTRRTARPYHAFSRDGGRRWQPRPIARAASDEASVPPASCNQYADYAGLAAREGTVHALWTQRGSKRSHVEEVRTSFHGPGAIPVTPALARCLATIERERLKGSVAENRRRYCLRSLAPRPKTGLQRCLATVYDERLRGEAALRRRQYCMSRLAPKIPKSP
jgi:hypothetical protein